LNNKGPVRLLTLALATGCLALLGLPGSAASGATLADATKPISLDAASTNFDYRNNLLTFRKVRIAQGGMSVEADEATATGLDFENSEWRFMGAVHIRMPNGLLNSDSATITFRNNLITNAKIAGSPADFQQERVEQQVARGRPGPRRNFADHLVLGETPQSSVLHHRENGEFFHRPAAIVWIIPGGCQRRAGAAGEQREERCRRQAHDGLKRIAMVHGRRPCRRMKYRTLRRKVSPPMAPWVKRGFRAKICD